MSFLRVLWDDPGDRQGNVQHVAEHGLDIEDVEEVLSNPTAEGLSDSSGLPIVWGYTLEVTCEDGSVTGTLYAGEEELGSRTVPDPSGKLCGLINR